ncbi:MAG: ABC transporter substrate-binding protein [Candidatus Korobacteraceae bacterium]
MRKLTSVAVILAACVLLFAVGCTKKEAKEIRVGVVEAQSGMFASFGQSGGFGVQAAVDDINKQGGVQVGSEKIPIKLFFVDDESDPNKAGSLGESLITQNNVQFIVSGDEPPHMHAGVSKACDRYKVPYVTSVGPMEPWLGMRSEAPEKWKYTWATGVMAIATPVLDPKDPRFQKAGYTVLDTWLSVLKKMGPQTNKKVGVFAADDPDGRGWYTLFGPILKKEGYTPIGIDKNLGLVPLETTDFSSIIKAWKDAGVEILWGNAPGPFFGAAWKQCASMGFKPKVVDISRGALFYNDVAAWGGDLPWGVGTEVWWDPSMKDSPGIGGTTPQSLADRWVAAKNQPELPNIGPGYRSVQVLADAIQRAGSLDPEKVNAALATTNMNTIVNLVKYDENHFNHGPVMFGQWFKTDKPAKFELKIVYSDHDFAPTSAQPIFPMPSSGK